MNEARILRRCFLRWVRRLKRHYVIVQRAARGERGKLQAAPQASGVVRRFLTSYLRSFVHGWNEGIALYLAPLIAVRRMLHRAMRRLRNRRH